MQSSKKKKKKTNTLNGKYRQSLKLDKKYEFNHKSLF